MNNSTCVYIIINNVGLRVIYDLSMLIFTKLEAKF